MNKIWRSALFLLLAPLFFVEVASADTLFTFTYLDNTGNAATASVLGSDIGGGSFLANTGTLTVTGGADIGTYSLLSTTGLTPYQAGAVYSPSGEFIFDDILLIGGNPFLDTNGLVFVGNGLEINLWGNSTNNYSFYSWNGSSYNVAVDGGTDGPLTASVPEPSSLALLGLGAIFGMCLLLKQAGTPFRKLQFPPLRADYHPEHLNS